MVISEFLAALNLPVKTVGAIAFASAVLIFLPDGWSQKLNLSAFAKTYAEAIGIVFLISSSILVANALPVAVKMRKRANVLAAERRRVKKALQNLDATEKSILREFSIQQRNTVDMEMADIAVNGLCKKGILEPVGTFMRPSWGGIVRPYSLCATAKTQLTPQMIDMDDSGDSDIGHIMSRRPKFAVSLQNERQMTNSIENMLNF